MKSILFGVFLLATTRLLISGPETPRGDKKAVVMPQEPKETCGWTGFYIGGSIGGAFDTADLNLELNDLWDTRLSFTRDVGEELGSKNLEANGLIAGGFLGYNYQWSSWVVGLEGGFAYLGLRDSSNSGYEFVSGDGGNVIDLRQSFKTHYLATLGPRFGYAWNQLLFYATGGVAFTDFRFSQELNELDFGMRQEGSNDDVEVGWTVGGGLEYCLARHWSVRVEYRYNDFECADFSTSAVPRPGVPNVPSGFTGHHEACLSFHSVTAGLAYRF